MISFLILPMQRVTRLPLLMDVSVPTFFLLFLRLLLHFHSPFCHHIIVSLLRLLPLLSPFPLSSSWDSGIYECTL